MIELLWCSVLFQYFTTVFVVVLWLEEFKKKTLKKYARLKWTILNAFCTTNSNLKLIIEFEPQIYNINWQMAVLVNQSFDTIFDKKGFVQSAKDLFDEFMYQTSN